MNKKNAIVLDIDQTLTLGKDDGETYSSLLVAESVKNKIKEYKDAGFWIILSTSRNMRTYNGNIGQIMKHTAPILIDWLEKNEIPYDEIHFGKPWCGDNGFYVDDRAIRPKEFVDKSFNEIQNLLESDRFKKVK